MTTEAIVMDAEGRVRKQSDLPGATDPIVFYMGRAQPLSVAGVDVDDTDPFVVDDTDPERVRRYSQTDEASAPPAPPPPPPPPPPSALDPAAKGPNVVLSVANTVATFTVTWGGVLSEAAHDAATTSGYYAEMVCQFYGFVRFGIADAGVDVSGYYYVGIDGHSQGFASDGGFLVYGDRVGLLMDDGYLYVRKNGTWVVGDGDARTGGTAVTLSGPVKLIVASPGGTWTVDLNAPFVDTLPSGSAGWGAA